MQDLLIWITLQKGQAAMRENTIVSVAENSRISCSKELLNTNAKEVSWYQRDVRSMEGDALVMPASGFILLPLTSCQVTNFLFWSPA